MYYSKLKNIRLQKGITLEKLARMANVSARIFMPFRKRHKEKPIDRSNGKNCKGIK